MPEQRSTYGSGFIAGLGPAFAEAENQADSAYSLAINSALGVEANNYTRLFKDWKTVQARETFGKKTGIGYGALTTEGQDYNTDDRIAGYETQFNPIKKTSGIIVTEELRDDRDRKVARAMDEVTDLKVSSMMTMDRDAFDLFAYSFTAQASLPSDNHLTYYGDGVPFCSTIHPIRESTTSNTTQSNASDSGVTLTEINLATGRQAWRRQNDDKDLPMNIGSGRGILLVPDALEKAAMIITKSTKRSGTVNNDLNIYDGIFTVISTKWVNSQHNGTDTNWWIIDSIKSPAVVMGRRSYTSTIWQDDRSKNITYDYSVRYQVGNIDWRGVWGSKGDGALYSS